MAAVERLDDENRQLDVGEQADGEVDRLAADEVAVGDGALARLRIAHVDDQVDVAGRQHGVHVGRLVGGRLVQQLARDLVLRGEEVVRALRAEDLEPHGHELPDRRQHLELGVERADAQEDVALGRPEARRAHRGEDGLVLVLAEGGHLAGRRHLDAKHGVRADEAREREHRRLDADVVDVEQRDLRGHDVRACHDARGDLDEVDLERLGDEGEGARRAHVGLDHLDLVVLGEELQVERPRDVELLGDRAHDALDAAARLDVELLCGQHERGVARVHAGVLDVLADRVVDHVAVVGDGVDLDLLGALDELGDDDRVVGRHLACHREELFEVLVVKDDLHRGAREHVARPDEARVVHSVAKLLGRGQRRALGPLGLVDADRVEDA
mmetsp:Transcript_32049/g.83890  ORF Transcript_32049/g.83890 Transcript_32049/m.83890 type:complete len:384 (+) Transcript_32049:741-1892(+)